ncbi:MAG TPA: TolC family protein [candidate division Zixibacteria bacterium]|nr:TolC family protein [candidate division Zixibacteria bacterium]
MRNVAKYIVMTVVTFMTLFPGMVMAENLTLGQAIRTALANNDKIRQYRAKLDQAKYSDREASGNFLPSISLQAGYNHMNDPLSIDLSPIRDAMIQMQASNEVEFTNIYQLMGGGSALSSEERAAYYSQYSAALDGLLPAFVETFKDQDYRTASVTLVQPLFTGGKIVAAKKAANAEKHAAEDELAKIENEITQETINNYLAVILLQQVVQTRENVLSGMERHRSNAQRLAEEGLIARYDLLRAEVAVADAGVNLFDDRNRLELAKVALRNTLGLDDDAPIVIADTLLYHPVADSLAEFHARAYDQQPILQMIAEKKKAASQKYAVERSSFLPQLAGFGKYELYDNDLSALEPRWIIGLQLNLNIFNGFKDHSRLQGAKSLKREVEYLESGARREVDLWVNKSYRDMRNAETRFQKLEASVALSSESVRLNEKRFQTGLGTSLEVIDAHLSNEKNQVERLMSLYDYYKSLTDLMVAAGYPLDMLTVWNGEEK